jgi:hypothetical protein
MGPRQDGMRDTHDVIVDPPHALVLQGMDHGSVIDCSHDHRGREPSHVHFPSSWAFKNPTGQQDGLCHLYVVERLRGRLV